MAARRRGLALLLLPCCAGVPAPWPNTTVVAKREGADVGTGLPDASGTQTSQGVAFLDASLCVRDLREVQVIELRTQAGEPLSGLRFMLLRPTGRTAGGYKVVALSGRVPEEEAKLFAHLSGRTLESPLPGDTAVSVALQHPFLGRRGDCLGWYQTATGTGGVQSWPWQAGEAARAVQSASLETVWRASFSDEPTVGARIGFTADLGRTHAVAWRVALTLRELQDAPRPRRRRALGEMLRVMTNLPGITSGAYKRGLVSLFRSPAWAEHAAIEIGSGSGGTTALLSMLFSMVYAAELNFPLIERSNGGRLAGLRNVAHLCLDSMRPYALSMLAGNTHIRAAVIDGEHNRNGVFRDTYGVLHDIPCCVRVVVYHDYCDQVVFETVQLFVEAGVLRFRHGLGDDPGIEWWCQGGRPEGAVFDVTGGLGWLERLEALHHRFIGAGSPGDIEVRLNGSTWWIDRWYFLTLELRPKLARVVLVRPHETSDLDWFVLGSVKVLGWILDKASEPRWGRSVLRAEVRAPGQEESSAPCALLTFEPDLTGFTLMFFEGPAGIGRRCGASTWGSDVMVGLRQSATQALRIDVHQRSV